MRNLPGLLASPNPALACRLFPSWTSRDLLSGSVIGSKFFSMFGVWVFHKTHSCNCTTTLCVRTCINPKQGKMSLGWWAHLRDGFSEPCAREPTHTRSKRITSTWASAAVWLIHSSRFQFNIKHDQEEKLREVPLVQSVPRHCCWGLF